MSSSQGQALLVYETALLALHEGAFPIVIDPLEKRLEIARLLGVKYI